MRSNIKRAQRPEEADTNRLFPVFVKLEQLEVLVIGGGKVATEKLSAILGNCPSASIRIVSKTFSTRLKKLAAGSNVVLIRKAFEAADLKNADLVFSAVNDVELSKKISSAARKLRILHNAADKPGFCDFYLGSIVQKGNLKIGISTNGKSPTVARRLKQILDEALPAELDDSLRNLSRIRSKLKGDLKSKARQLNRITSILAAGPVAARRSRKRNKL